MTKFYLICILILILFTILILKRKNIETIIDGHGFTEKPLVKSPEIKGLYNFLSKFECNYIINLAKNCFEKSTVTHKDKYQNSRTSYTCFLTKFKNDSIIKRIKQRIVEYLNIDKCQLEELQVVRYYPGQKYDYHYDWFDNKTIENKNQLKRGGQRIYTIFIYLNDLNETNNNGSTCFEKINFCSKPEEGLGIFWKNTVDGKVDYRTKHAGIAPKNSIKYGMNVWVREKCFV